jgi:hypothetical protein
MLQTIQTRYHKGQISLSEGVAIPDNSIVYISFKDNTKDDFFLKASESSLENIWNNSEDDIYEQLLEK